jgi:hypothetical protein
MTRVHLSVRKSFAIDAIFTTAITDTTPVVSACDFWSNLQDSTPNRATIVWDHQRLGVILLRALTPLSSLP